MRNYCICCFIECTNHLRPSPGGPTKGQIVKTWTGQIYWQSLRSATLLRSENATSPDLHSHFNPSQWVRVRVRTRGASVSEWKWSPANAFLSSKDLAVRCLEPLVTCQRFTQRQSQGQQGGAEGGAEGREWLWAQTQDGSVFSLNIWGARQWRSRIVWPKMNTFPSIRFSWEFA